MKTHSEKWWAVLAIGMSRDGQQHFVQDSEGRPLLFHWIERAREYQRHLSLTLSAPTQVVNVTITVSR